MAVSLGYQNVYRYPEGYPEWLDLGYPVTASTGLEIPATEANPVSVPTGFNFLLVLAAVFVGGMALNLTPCIYPLIPITVSYFGGRSQTITGSKLGHGLLYIVGLSLTNSTLGVVAAVTGGLVGALLQNSLVLLGIAALLVLFALSLFGFWEIRLPTKLNVMASKTYQGYGGSLFMGLTLGVVAAPCIGPFVIGLLSWIAAIGKVWFGFLVFFILSLGMGLPLFLLALFSSNIDRLPRSGEWMIWIKKLMGWILVAMAIYFIGPLLSEATKITVFSIAAVGAGIHLGWLEKSVVQSPKFGLFKKGIGVICLLIAVTVSVSYLNRGLGVIWSEYSEALMEQARAESKPVIIDFSAEWCAPCRELDKKTFHDPEVVELSRRMIMIKVNLTAGAGDYQPLIDQFEIKGVPTVIFITGDGRERRDLRLVDYLPAAKFSERMNQIL